MHRPARAAQLVLTLTLALTGLAPVARASEVADVGIGLGPLDLRNEFVLSLAHLTLAADSPDLLPPGRFRVAIRGDWAQSIFDEPEAATAVHAETVETALLLGAGLSDWLEARIELPFVNRSGGILDPFIYGFETLVGGQSVARRRIGRDDRFVFEGTTDEGTSFSFRPGTGLEKLRVGLKFRLLETLWSGVALELVTALPTARRDFGSQGVDGGARLSAGQRLGPLVAYAGASAVILGDDRLEEIRLARWKGTAFAALELDVADWVALVAQAWAETASVVNVHHADGLILYIGGGAKARLDRYSLEIGLIENAEDQARSADITFHAEVGVSF